MSRRTRSGAQFSPYELLQLPERLRHFEIIQTNISLDALLHDAVADDDRYAAEQDAAKSSPEDAWEDEDEDEDDVASESVLPPTPPSPLTPISSSSSSSAAPSPHASRPTSPQTSRPTPTAGPHISVNKSRARQQHAIRRARRRQRQHVDETPYDRQPDPRYSQAHREQEPHTVHFDLADAPITAGAWVGRQRANAERRHRTLPELLDEGGEVIEWNGRDPKLILDAEGRIIAILLGTPEDQEWAVVVEDAVAAMARARREALREGEWRVGTLHRRGTHLPVRDGVSFGGGQKRPGNLCHTPFIRRLVRRLLRNKSIRRIAGFQSMGLALYAPKLYRYYCKVLRALFRKHPNLTHTFRNSIFPAVTLNCGDTVTFEHCDILNLVHGLCPITCGGRFNHVLGGHLYLRQLRLIIQFPSAATILIPSGCLDHGNTPIQAGETRYSMTQYAAGGLFRWAAYGFQSAKSLLAQPGGEDVKNTFDGVPGSRWKWGLDLFSKSDELLSDRVAVFQSS
ncbi:hypothetical protein B0H16DRAFT_1730979 [Mycena metata]|uniref:Uncharacterized protein n=1 Tax=Mycena metata TaxID=1033252 RepID=A0AAD7MXA6_9AGAR|nr:hypothetical protein B0H16DRAFT_1730979 [Mycena metata]